MRLEGERIRRILDAGPGDPYKGEPIFMQRCAPCHTLFYKGGHIGPNLSDYQRQDVAALLHNILEPSAEIREGFENYTVRTKDGRTLSGVLVDDDPSIIVIRGTDGQDTRVPHDQVKSMKKSPLSLMPEGLLLGMTDQELRDFFAYLRIPQPISQ
jgi:putative heme-binding domain-containing protein